MTYKHDILKACTRKPCKPEAFTHNTALNCNVSPRHVYRYLAELVADGLLEQSGDFYIATEEGVEQVTATPTIAASRQHCGASQPNWTPPKWEPSRPGANDHLRFSSRGIGA